MSGLDRIKATLLECADDANEIGNIEHERLLRKYVSGMATNPRPQVRWGSKGLRIVPCDGVSS